MKIKRVYLDMDGVLVDFHRGVHDAFDVPYDYEGSMRYDFWVDWHVDVSRLDVDAACNESFWENLDWMRDGKDILIAITKVYEAKNVFFLTCPMPNAESWTGKKLWVVNMVENYVDRLIITHASKTIFAAPDTLLIDDKEENVDEFIRAGGNAILIPRPWNRLRKHKVIEHLENAITSVNNLEYILGKPEEVSSHPDTGTIPPFIKEKLPPNNYHGHPQFYALLNEMADLHSRKNHDYAGKGNPLRNFYKCKEMGLSPFQGVMVRLSDKWSRLESFMRQGTLEVKNESVKDTLMDNAVYSLLAMILLDEESKDKECPENAPQD